MTIYDAVRCNEQLRLFMVAEDAANDTNRFLEESYTALDMSINALRNMELLTDRPCLICKNHTDTGCKEWDCPFDSVVVSETEYEYAIFDDTDSIRSQPMDSLEDAQELLEKFKYYGNRKFCIKKRPIVKWEIDDNE